MAISTAAEFPSPSALGPRLGGYTASGIQLSDRLHSNMDLIVHSNRFMCRSLPSLSSCLLNLAGRETGGDLFSPGSHRKTSGSKTVSFFACSTQSEPQKSSNKSSRVSAQLISCARDPAEWRGCLSELPQGTATLKKVV